MPKWFGFSVSTSMNTPKLQMSKCKACLYPKCEGGCDGGCRVVLVGDPQQLPATVLSRQAQLANMERSMFERFQKAGCPVTMLSVQYRMHPFIRQFPSQHFYNNQLLDGWVTLVLSPPPYPTLGTSTLCVVLFA